MERPISNIDKKEVSKFEAQAASWWDVNGPFKTLHHINTARLEYIQARVNLANQNILDVGCGGGILSESLAKAHANVTAIDASESAIQVAKRHAKENHLNINYQHTTIDNFTSNEKFDVITCLELIEHVPQPQQLLHDCVKFLKPGGSIFVSTINRNLKAYALAILGAEYILRLLPRGTHDYQKFITPAELAHFYRELDIELLDISGIKYNPLLKQTSITRDCSVNYITHGKHS